jgi:molybdopterin adenylyltransferase
MTMGRNEHLKQAPKIIKISIITVSTTRSAAEDKSGSWIKRECEKEGHEITDYRIVTDNRHEITKAISATIDTHRPDIVIVNGGTGISSSDVTIEAVKPLFTKELTGFSILFATLSFQQIDSAAILSRATAGVIGNTALFCMPGSLNACKLACIELIFPEIPHLVAHLRN